MAEQTHVRQVTTNDPKTIEAGKRLAEYNRRKREELAQMKVREKRKRNHANLL